MPTIDPFPPPWSFALRIDGNNVAPSPTAALRLDVERGAARTLQVALDVDGTIDPNVWTARPVTLDVTLGTVTLRRFTGAVDEAQVDAYGHTLTLHCTDARIAKLNAMTRPAIDALLGTAPHAAFVRDSLNGAQYAQAALAQTFNTAHLDADGTWRVASVLAKLLPDWSFDGDDFYDGTLRVTLTPARDVVNRLTVNATAQRLRYWWRRAAVSWRWTNTFLEYLARDRTLPNEGMFRSAAQKLGWFVRGYTFERLPEAGLYYTDTGGKVPDGVNVSAATNVQGWNNPHPELITRGVARLETWWTQRVNLTAALVFEVATSVSRYGARTATDTANWTARNEVEWEAAETPAVRPVPGSAPVEQLGGYQYYDSTPAADDNGFVDAVIARALRKLYDAHSANTVVFDMPYHLGLVKGAVELEQTVRVEHKGRAAQGIVTRLSETLDIEGNDAHTTVTLSLCRGGESALATPVHDYTAPAIDPTAPTLGAGTGEYSSTVSELEQLGNEAGAVYDDDKTGYSGNYGTQYLSPDTPQGPLFEVRLDLDTPDIPASLRDTLDAPHPATIVVRLPDDPLDLDLQ